MRDSNCCAADAAGISTASAAMKIQTRSFKDMFELSLRKAQ